MLAFCGRFVERMVEMARIRSLLIKAMIVVATLMTATQSYAYYLWATGTLTKAGPMPPPDAISYLFWGITALMWMAVWISLRQNRRHNRRG
jgi:hypothetical protein